MYTALILSAASVVGAHGIPPHNWPPQSWPSKSWPWQPWPTTATPTASQSVSATPTSTVSAIPVSASNAGGPLLDGFVSYSIEFAFFPDYAGMFDTVLDQKSERILGECRKPTPARQHQSPQHVLEQSAQQLGRFTGYQAIHSCWRQHSGLCYLRLDASCCYYWYICANSLHRLPLDSWDWQVVLPKLFDLA